MILRNFRLLLCAPLLCGSLLAQHYQASGNIRLGGNGGWDYLTVDSGHRRLYVSHESEVDVIDLDSEKPVGKITGMKRVHGIALADGMNTGFISDGGSNEVVAFDIDTLAVKQKIAAGTNPDGIAFDPASKRVFAFNGRSQNATAIDAANMRVAGTIALGGKPEFPIADGQGNVYDNIEDKNEIVQIDSKTLEVKAHWSVAPCESPSGLAFDAENRRLFAVCDGGKMAVVDADSGKVVATPAIGDGPDAAAFDPGKHLAFSSNGDGTLTVVRQVSKDSYKVLENVPTTKGARTMALDPKTHKIYLSTASYGPAPAASVSNPRPRPSILPGSFKILIVSPK
jgi:DNA-binding beta-propeller fold protein YncE